jgi:hypothetical protein
MKWKINVHAYFPCSVPLAHINTLNEEFLDPHVYGSCFATDTRCQLAQEEHRLLSPVFCCGLGVMAPETFCNRLVCIPLWLIPTKLWSYCSISFQLLSFHFHFFFLYPFFFVFALSVLRSNTKNTSRYFTLLILGRCHLRHHV